MAYTMDMPKLWNDTIQTHRREVREAILDRTWELATQRGPTAVTMSEIAARAGIGRATLYKYFPDVEAILSAWHNRRIRHHLAHLAEVRDESADPAQRLRTVLEAYALIQAERLRHHHAPHAELATLLHRGDEVARAQRQLHRLIHDLLIDAQKNRDVRTDFNAGELATYCLCALSGAGALDSKAAIRRLVALTLTAVKP